MQPLLTFSKSTYKWSFSLRILDCFSVHSLKSDSATVQNRLYTYSTVYFWKHKFQNKAILEHILLSVSSWTWFCCSRSQVVEFRPILKLIYYNVKTFFCVSWQRLSLEFRYASPCLSHPTPVSATMIYISISIDFHAVAILLLPKTKSYYKQFAPITTPYFALHWTFRAATMEYCNLHITLASL